MSETKPDPPSMSYLSLYPILRRAAREHGYALALHGSLTRDMDLVAIPWRDDVSDHETLARGMAEATGLYFVDGWSGPHQLPGGRIGHKLTPGGDLYLDISILPSITAAERRGAERALRWAWMVADEYAAPDEEEMVSKGLAALFPEGGR